MENEINNFIKVWFTVFASLTYSYFISKQIPKGKFRLVSLLPIVIIFILLPLTLYSMHLGGITAFFIAWLANFKLLLFAFDQGPLSFSQNTYVSLPVFICIACLPIKMKSNTKNGATPSIQIDKKSFLQSIKKISNVIKVVLLALVVYLYDYEQYLHPTLVLLLYCFHIYFSLEIMLATVATMVQSLLGLELEPHFQKPYLATSLQDFWGKRWNLIVTSILRQSVYYPMLRVSSGWIGKRWAQKFAVFATFIVSGLMHELMFYYLGRVKPTWEVMLFFVLHGVCLAVEIAVKKSLKDRWQLHPVVSTPLALGFVVATGYWLFFPQLLRCDAVGRALNEYAAVVEFLKSVRHTMMISLAKIVKYVGV
ncbi:hypothetical protein AQUCO_02800147v1 [Aquilegia coerulea]|uniref:Wax synthase domain-containing protein n=1 Tax=Aquilegia coerulea TaxID=218851 RepID=A0A2G5D423_AQUCA|nr:hypothetical protein AQUCO_02800147v1 [Aquilegia coerulea]